MRFPSYLPEGGTIGFVAPSFGCAAEPYRSAFDHSLAVWKQKSYQTLIGPNAYAGEGIGISNTPQLCGKELTEGYLSEDSDVLISCGGGELMCEILDYVDFEAVRQAKPKWYMGYSDNTNFTFLLTTLCDTASIYGPCAASFGMEPWHASIDDALALLTGRKLTMRGYDLFEIESLKDEAHPLLPYHVTEKSILVGGDSNGDVAMLTAYPETVHGLLIDVGRAPDSAIGRLVSEAKALKKAGRNLVQPAFAPVPDGVQGGGI